MKHAYGSLNKALQTIWTTVASGKTILFERPVHPAVLQPDTLLVTWLNIGGPTGQPNEYTALVQLDIYAASNARATSIHWASEIDRLLGFQSDGGYGILGRHDWTIPAAPVDLTAMRVEPYEPGWVSVPDPDPRLIHYARTIVLTYLVN